MLPYRPAGLQRRHPSDPLQIVALGCLGAALVAFWVVLLTLLLTRFIPPALDASANPAIARDYGNFAPVRQ